MDLREQYKIIKKAVHDPFNVENSCLVFLRKRNTFFQDFRWIESSKEQYLFKVPLLWVMKGSYFGFGSPQQQVDMHARSKNTFIFL